MAGDIKSEIIKKKTDLPFTVSGTPHGKMNKAVLRVPENLSAVITCQCVCVCVCVGRITSI